ncbi:hypothetical protein [Bacillus cereus]|uniref:hypothetical protein n=1 Tax=Bacillus cereus TaxID=1396 RepID=UPI000B4B658B|nr:hypothetical protein [Bacillus cereus]
MLNFYKQYFWINYDNKSLLNIRLKEKYEQFIQHSYRCILISKNESYVVLFSKSNSNFIQDNKLFSFGTQIAALSFIQNELNQIIEDKLVNPC